MPIAWSIAREVAVQMLECITATIMKTLALDVNQSDSEVMYFVLYRLLTILQHSFFDWFFFCRVFFTTLCRSLCIALHVILQLINETNFYFSDVCTNGQIRLLGGVNPRQGRVEICYYNQWGTVCDDGFGAPEASVICQQLGFSDQCTN